MIGIRPMYYHHPVETSKQLIFTSEIKGASNFPEQIIEFKPGQIMTFELNEFGSVIVTQKLFDWVSNVKPLESKIRRILFIKSKKCCY